MPYRFVMLFGGLMLGTQAYGQAAQPGAMLLAQAQDRCMATHAVQLSRTSASDEEVYATASARCKELKTRLDAAIAKEYTAEQAQQLTGMLNEQAKPDFMRMLQKIRADRQAAAGN